MTERHIIITATVEIHTSEGIRTFEFHEAWDNTKNLVVSLHDKIEEEVKKVNV